MDGKKKYQYTGYADYKERYISPYAATTEILV